MSHEEAEPGSSNTGPSTPEPPDQPAYATAMLNIAWRFLAGGALLLAGLLVAGFLLPREWSIERTMSIPATPEAIFVLLESPESWERWNPWPEVELTRTGPPTGVGATMSWDDPFAGDGVFMIVESQAPTTLSYRVEVEGGSMITEGRFELVPDGVTTRVRWSEDGDFGWNPMMAFAALNMDRTQGAELERGLVRLKEYLETGRTPATVR